MGEPLDIVDGLLARLRGPLAFRLVLQPLVALYFGIRDGIEDHREGRQPYVWALFKGGSAAARQHRRELLSSGWRSVGKVFLVAIAVDVVFQYLVFRSVRPLGALLAAGILALVPYLLVRGPINRLMPK